MQSTEPEPGLLSPWQIPQLPSWVSKVNEAMTDTSLQKLQKSAQPSTLYGETCLDPRNIQTPQAFRNSASSWPPANSFSNRRTKQRVLTPFMWLPEGVHRGVANGDFGQGVLFSIGQTHHKEVSHAAAFGSVDDPLAVGRRRCMIVQSSLGGVSQLLGPTIERDSK